MLTLYDLGMEIAKIREAANGIEIKGAANAARIVLITDTCNELIQAINEVTELAADQPSVGQNGEDALRVDVKTDCIIAEEEGEINGEPDSGTAS